MFVPTDVDICGKYVLSAAFPKSKSSNANQLISLWVGL